MKTRLEGREAVLSGVGKAARRGELKVGRVVVSAIPWLIIGFLLWAGLFIKPQPVGATVSPPVMERRDYYYGLAPLASGGMWLAGSNGKLVAVGAGGQAERLASGTEQSLQDVAVWDAQHGVAVGNDGVVVRTEDGGRHWTAVADVPRSAVANKLNRVRVGADGQAWATGEMGALLYTADYGQHWKRLRGEEDQAWNDVAVLADGRLVVVGEFGKVALSADGGEHWSDIEGPVQSSLMAVSFRDARYGVAVGLEGVALATADGGKTWRRLETGVHDHLFDIAWDAAGSRWVGAGSLGRWLTVGADGAIKTGRLDERDLSWHTRVVPQPGTVWLAGANVGQWRDGRWQVLGTP